MEEIKEPLLIKSLVNGLIATSIIWIFWTPFLIFIASPLMNAIIKNFLYQTAGSIPYMIYSIFGTQAFEIYETSLPHPPTVANKVIEENKQNFLNENINSFVVFTIMSILVIYFSLFFASKLIINYNLNVGEIVLFNVVMAIIIISIETAFFIGVTTKYSPFTINGIIGQLAQKIKDLLLPLSQPIENGSKKKK